MSSDLKFKWDTDTLKWDTSRMREHPYASNPEYTHISDLKFAWDTDTFKHQQPRQPRQNAPRGTYTPPAQQYANPVIIQAPPQQPQYVPQLQSYYPPMQQQAPVVVHSGGHTGGTNPIVRLIEFIVLIGIALAMVYFLWQTPTDLHGYSNMIDLTTAKIANFLGGII